MAMTAGRPFRVTTATTDAFDTTNPNQAGVMLGAKLTGGAGAATAQLVDGNGTVLADLACAAGGADYADIPVVFVGKVRVNTLTGTGAIVNVWIQ